MKIEDQILAFAEAQWGKRTDEQIALKACGECGEFAEAVTKMGERRTSPEDADLEVGDVLIVLSQWAAKRGTTLEELRAVAFNRIKARVEENYHYKPFSEWDFGTTAQAVERLDHQPQP